MNRKLLVVLGVSILTLTAATQTFAASSADTSPPTTQGAGKEKRGEALERFKSALEQINLSADQKEKIKAIFTRARSKLQAVKGESGPKGEAREILQQARKEIIAVLDEPQRAKLKEILQNDRAQAKA